MTLILVYGLLFDGLKLREAVVDKVDVGSIDAAPKSIRYFQRILHLEVGLNVITRLQFDPCVADLVTRTTCRINYILEILLLFAVAIRFIKASKDLHHLVMLFFVGVFRVAHPIHEGRFTVEISASLRHHLQIIVFQRFALRLIFYSITVSTVFGARDPRIVNIRSRLLDGDPSTLSAVR